MSDTPKPQRSGDFILTVFSLIMLGCVVGTLLWFYGHGYIGNKGKKDTLNSSTEISIEDTSSASINYTDYDETSPDPDKIFNAVHYVSDNGLQIVVIPNHRAPVITQMVWYKVGAADEPAGKSGIAHFLEHLMFKGSEVIGREPLAPGEFSEVIKRLGGNDNAFTGQDYTAYYQSIAKEHLETVMRMEAGRMRGMALPVDEVRSERDVILEERRQRTDNSPQARLAEQIDAALFVNHPYATPVIGWAHEMEKLEHQDALDFYKRYYAPNNAILVISGDVKTSHVLALAHTIYGPILPSEDIPALRERPSPPILATLATINYEDPAVHETVIQKEMHVPSTRQEKQDALALEILSDILGGGSTSRIYRSLVVEQKIATNAGLGYNGDMWDDGTLTLYAIPSQGVTTERVFEALDDELRRLIREGVTEKEVQESKTRMQDAATFALDSLSGPAMIVGKALATGNSLDDVEYWARDISAITTDEINMVARTYLNPDQPNEKPVVKAIMSPKAPDPQLMQPQEVESIKTVPVSDLSLDSPANDFYGAVGMLYATLMKRLS